MFFRFESHLCGSAKKISHCWSVILCRNSRSSFRRTSKEYRRLSCEHLQPGNGQETSASWSRCTSGHQSHHTAGADKKTWYLSRRLRRVIGPPGPAVVSKLID